MEENNLHSWRESISLPEQTFWHRLALTYETHITEISNRHLSASRLGVKYCTRCGLCCYQYPCIPRPEEIDPVADFLGLSVAELISRFTVINTADCKIYFLRWAKHGQEDIAGKMIPPARTFDRGYCIFFNIAEKQCLIYPVRPREASAVKCWQQNCGRNRSLWGITSWDKGSIFQFLPDFSPKPSETNEYLPPKSSMAPRLYEEG